MTAPNAEAKKALADAFKETPNPNRSELQRIRRRVNEVLVTETAREVTGDKTLKTPAELQVMHAIEEAAQRAQIEAKPWSEMSNDERAQFIASKWQVAVFALFVVAAGGFGWRTISAAQRGY